MCKNEAVMSEDARFMRAAIDEAVKAADAGEVPVGAVVVKDGRIVVGAHNRREGWHDATAHAELLAISAAGRMLGGWRLSDCTLYVTLEPCAMCAGSIVNARVGRVVFGAHDAVAGAMGSVLNLPRYPLGAAPEVTGGVLAAECAALLQRFFKEKR